MTVKNDPAVSNSPLFKAYERASYDPIILDALFQIDLTFKIDHADSPHSAYWFGTQRVENEPPTIRIRFTATEFAERFWSGSEPLVLALVQGHLTIHGPVNRILELVGVLPLLFASLAESP